jgi:urocanate hydratase
VTSTVTGSAVSGGALRARTWRAEALLRALENVLDVGQRPGELIVYASFAKAARDHEALDRIRSELLNLEPGHTLVLQSGRPVGVLPTGPNAPLVVSAVNNTVGRWQTPQRFWERAAAGDTIWGGLTAAAWQYIGRQGVLQGTYEVFRLALTETGTPPAGTWILTAGLGGMGSAQPLAARMAGTSSITVEVDPAALDRSRRTGGVEVVLDDVASALAAVDAAARVRRPLAVGLLGNAATAYPEILQRLTGAARAGTTLTRPGIATDMTAAHDLRAGYLPPQVALEDWPAERDRDPAGLEKLAGEAIGAQVDALLGFARAGAVVFENGNNLRVQAAEHGLVGAFTIDGFVPRYLRPLFARGIGPFRWIALSGDDADLAVLDELAVEVTDRPEVADWIALARDHVQRQGLPARSCWLGHGERSAMARAADAAVRTGRLQAPVLFTRDHLDAAGMTHPRIGTEAMPDGSDGVSDWPLLDAMLLAATGADLVAVHGGGGGYSGWMQSAGVSVVADGEPGTAERITRALDADTGLGVLRYAEAGSHEARRAVTAHDLHWTATGTNGSTVTNGSSVTNGSTATKGSTDA